VGSVFFLVCFFVFATQLFWIKFSPV